MFEDESDVRIAVMWEGSVEHDLSFVAFLDLTFNDETNSFQFRDKSQDNTKISENDDVMQAKVYKLAVDFLEDNSTIKLEGKFSVDVQIIPELGKTEDYNKFAMSNYTLEEVLRPLDPSSMSEFYETWQKQCFKKYKELSGLLSNDRYKEYLAFFMHIFPVVFLGNGNKVGLTHDNAKLIWDYYLVIKGVHPSISIKEGYKILQSVEHNLAIKDRALL
jgi:hypothetical protein